jgi:hypothetical protein
MCIRHEYHRLSGWDGGSEGVVVAMTVLSAPGSALGRDFRRDCSVCLIEIGLKLGSKYGEYDCDHDGLQGRLVCASAALGPLGQAEWSVTELWDARSSGCS